MEPPRPLITPDLDALEYRPSFEENCRTLDGMLDRLDQALLKYRSAWGNVNSLVNEAVMLRAVYRRVIDMADPHSGIRHEPNFKKFLAPVIEPPPKDIDTKLRFVNFEVTKLADGKQNQLMRWPQDTDSSWNANYLRLLIRTWREERERLERAMIPIKLYVPSPTLIQLLASGLTRQAWNPCRPSPSTTR